MRRFLLVAALLLLATGCRSERPSQDASIPTPPAAAPPVVLEGEALELQAHMEPFTGSDLNVLFASPEYGAKLRGLRPDSDAKQYPSDRFGCFLPGHPVKVGESWSVSAEEATNTFLTQFAPTATARLNIDGAGAYAVLRAANDDYWDIRCRVHAQFEFNPGLFVTPAEFDGELLVNLKDKSVEYFKLSVPTDYPTNLAFEVPTDNGAVGLGFVPRMELVGGSPKKLVWQDSIDDEQARQTLSRRFFAFQKIDWVPPEDALEKAAQTHRPIFAVVIKGVLDDQSC